MPNLVIFNGLLVKEFKKIKGFIITEIEREMKNNNNNNIDE